MIETFTKDTFCKEDVFKVHCDDGQVYDMMLFSVNLGNGKLPSASREPFSLVFKGSKELYFLQGIYNFEHSKTGAFQIFIVPIVAPGGDKEWSYYEAVFS